MKITYKDVTEYDTHCFSAEASTLGLKPGEVPKRIETDMGNKQPFTLFDVSEYGFRYKQSLGCITLLIMND